MKGSAGEVGASMAMVAPSGCSMVVDRARAEVVARVVAMAAVETEEG